MSNKTRSPLKDNPLRNPGQSLDEEIDKLVNDQFMSYALVPIMLFAMAAMEWSRWFLEATPSPWLFTTMAVVSLVFVIWKLSGLRRKLKALKQGRDGERAVGQFLESLREDGCKIFHDIIADNFNIDHVVLSERGFYLVETKTYSKPFKGEPIVNYDGNGVIVNGFKPDRNPVIQARASAKWLQNMLEESTGKSFPIRPVVLFPGWYIKETDEAKRSDTWVLTPQGLGKYIANQKPIISSTDLHLVKSRIASHIRLSNG